MEILYNRTGKRMLRQAAREFRPDLVYERHALHCRVGLDVARELGVPLLLEVNSPMCREMEKLGLLKFPRRARQTEREVLAGADRVLAVTEVLGGMLVEDGARAETVRVIPNGAQPERYGDEVRAAGQAIRERLGIAVGERGHGAEAPFVLGFVGYARPWHRLDLVLDCMARPGFESLHLVLVGDGPALDELEPAWRAAGLGERVHRVGAVPGELVPAHVCAFDAALIPAINPYASPLKLFDSLAAGVPTLAPRQPNLEETLTHGGNGLLFEPGSADDLAAGIRSLLDDRAGARALGDRGRASLDQRGWTWDANADRVAAAFHEVAQGAGPP